jgi:lipid-binding SYLF domain-containing protein
LLNVEVTDAMLKAATDVNTNTYGGNVTCEDIVEGKVPVPGGKAGEMIKSLHDKLTEHAEGKHAEEAEEEKPAEKAEESK